MFGSIDDFGRVSEPCEDCSKFSDSYHHCTMNCSGRKLITSEPRDLGSICIFRDEADNVTVRLRSPGERAESKITLPFEVWERIAIPPGLSVSVAGQQN